jgi:hypothetical protein
MKTTRVAPRSSDGLRSGDPAPHPCPRRLGNPQSPRPSEAGLRARSTLPILKAGFPASFVTRLLQFSDALFELCRLDDFGECLHHFCQLAGLRRRQVTPPDRFDKGAHSRHRVVERFHLRQVKSHRAVFAGWQDTIQAETQRGQVAR